MGVGIHEWPQVAHWWLKLPLRCWRQISDHRNEVTKCPHVRRWFNRRGTTWYLSPITVPLLTPRGTPSAVRGALWLQADGPWVGRHHVAATMNATGVGALVELIGHNAQVAVFHDDVTWDGGDKLLPILIPATPRTEREGRGRELYKINQTKVTDYYRAFLPFFPKSILLLFNNRHYSWTQRPEFRQHVMNSLPNFRRHLGTFCPTAEAYHFSTRHHLHLHVGRGWSGCADGI